MIGWPYDGVNPNPPPPPVNLFTEPETLVAGSNLFFYRCIPNCPASSWMLAYNAVSESGNKFAFVAVSDPNPNGDNFLINVPPVITDRWAPGRVKLQGLVTNVSDTDNPDAPIGTVQTVFDGWFEIKPSVATIPAGTDTRSKWMKIRDAVLEAILGRAGQEVLITGIEGQTFNYMTHEQLLALYNRAEQNVKIELAQARAKQNLPDGSTIYTRFTSPW
jgi:hypothetical protein